MPKLKIATVYALLGTAIVAVALPGAGKNFDALYGIKPGSTLGKAKCAVCHTSMKSKALNPYGKDIAAYLKAHGGGKKVSDAALKAVEGIDSAKAGGTNLRRIKADKLPGG